MKEIIIRTEKCIRLEIKSCMCVGNEILTEGRSAQKLQARTDRINVCSLTGYFLLQIFVLCIRPN